MSHPQCIDTIKGPGLSLSWRSWVQDGKRLLVADVGRLWASLKIWDARERMRAQLSDMDDHMLRDIGLTRIEAEREAKKPFWRA